jgi:Diacylglycerol acyltransferase
LKGVVFCFHPHGLMDIHSQALERHLFKKNILFKSTFEKKLFLLPFNRTFLYLLGYIPAVKENYDHLESKRTNIFTTPGDVAEYLLSGEPSTVVLSSNKIFFKLAIENGLTLVPIYAFDTERSFKFYPSLNKWRDKLKIGVQTLAIIPFSGRFFLPIPFKTVSKVAIGEPIKIEKNDNPNWEDIENCSKLYTSNLIKLYNENKSGKASSLKIL